VPMLAVVSTEVAEGDRARTISASAIFAGASQTGQSLTESGTTRGLNWLGGAEVAFGCAGARLSICRLGGCSRGYQAWPTVDRPTQKSVP